MSKVKKLFKIFWSMFKIGLCTFGGGYAMIAVIERELIEKQKIMGHDEFLDIIAIAESTPGPLAVNCATYIGYKVAGVLGSIFATFGVVLPSFVIIFAISFFFDKFIEITLVSYAFKGIQACVAFIILNAGIKMVKKLKLGWFNSLVFFATLILMVVLDLFAKNVSSIVFILIGGVLGVAIYLCGQFKNKNSTNQQDKGDK